MTSWGGYFFCSAAHAPESVPIALLLSVPRFCTVAVPAAQRAVVWSEKRHGKLKSDDGASTFLTHKTWKYRTP